MSKLKSYGSVPCPHLGRCTALLSRSSHTFIPTTVSAPVQLFNGAKIETMTGNYIAARDINIVTTVSSTHQSTESNGRARERKRCPLPVSSFEGRKSSLKTMHQHYAINLKTQHILVLYGLGGSGKSQLAYKFVEECQETNRYRFSATVCYICVIKCL